MSKSKIVIGFLFFLIFFVFLIGCQSPNLTAYEVTYNGNGSTSGKVYDSARYLPGNAVPVLGQGNLKKTGYVFAGWRTQDSQNRMIFDRAITKIDEDGTITYFEGSTFNMPPNDVTFYAQWQKESYSITYGNL
ncbi:MAG: InlB B-repeat-containing protein, partial [Spirochaetia bacterium]|nr:InlB B-repeat-containing protein [Spirochaetia bacterium]